MDGKDSLTVYLSLWNVEIIGKSVSLQTKLDKIG